MGASLLALAKSIYYSVVHWWLTAVEDGFFLPISTLKKMKTPQVIFFC